MFLTGWARAAGLRVTVIRTARGSSLLREANALLGAALIAAGFDAVEIHARKRA